MAAALSVLAMVMPTEDTAVVEVVLAQPEEVELVGVRGEVELVALLWSSRRSREEQVEAVLAVV